MDEVRVKDEHLCVRSLIDEGLNVVATAGNRTESRGALTNWSIAAPLAPSPCPITWGCDPPPHYYKILLIDYSDDLV